MNEYYHAWNCVLKAKPKLFKALTDKHNNLKEAWENLNEFDLARLGIRGEPVELLKEHRLSGAPFKEYESLKHDQIVTLTRRDAVYPYVLRELHDPPEILYIKGRLPSFNKHYLSIVGTRDMTAYGQRATKQIVSELNDDFVIVSGLARGVDTTAHRAAIENGLETVAVLGFGLNRIPQYLNKFAEQIVLVSEFPPNMPGDKWSFPQRNRVIAGLSKATIVVEAGLKSGAKITARFALDQNREVFAVPGEIYNDKSIGTNQLIKDAKAEPLLRTKDIYEKLGIEQASRPILTLPTYQQFIVDELQKQAQTKLCLMHKILIPAAKLTSSLTELELKNLIERGRNGKYFLKSQC
ncbi:DNA-processing protein DprA [Patescibacteria group bacterium]